MNIAVKLGGSLAKDRNSFLDLCHVISNLGSDHCIFLIPGGGHYADLVRKDDYQYHLPSAVSHQMALLAMSQYGYLLHHLIKDSQLVHLLNDFHHTTANGVYVWLPHADLIFMENMPMTWDFTSDSIAAFAAHYLHLEMLILLKSVDGFTPNMHDTCDKHLIKHHIMSNELKETDIVDPLFSTYIQGTACWIINGRFPQRLQELLITGHTYGTEIS